MRKEGRALSYRVVGGETHEERATHQSHGTKHEMEL